MALASQCPSVREGGAPRHHNSQTEIDVEKGQETIAARPNYQGQEILTLSADVTNLRDINHAIEMSMKKLGTPCRYFCRQAVLALVIFKISRYLILNQIWMLTFWCRTCCSGSFAFNGIER